MLKLRTILGEAPHLTVSQMFAQQRSIKDLFKKIANEAHVESQPHHLCPFKGALISSLGSFLLC